MKTSVDPDQLASPKPADLDLHHFQSRVVDTSRFSVIKVYLKYFRYSKTCVKPPLKNKQKKILMTNGSLMKVKVLQNASHGAFCNTFDLH